MPGAHRETDTRYCDALTIVEGQDFVYVNSKLWAVEGDPETHGDGDLISVSPGTVYISGKKIIIFTDKAEPDDAGHPAPPTDPLGRSENVFAYDGGTGSGSGS